jgi:hypothetical protein
MATRNLDLLLSNGIDWKDWIQIELNYGGNTWRITKNEFLWRLIATTHSGVFDILEVSPGAWTIGCFDRIRRETANFVLEWGPKNAVDVVRRLGKLLIVNPANRASGLVDDDENCFWVLTDHQWDKPDWRTE